MNPVERAVVQRHRRAGRWRGGARLAWSLVALALLAAGLVAGESASAAATGTFRTGSAEQTRFYRELGHNVSNLRGALASEASYDTSFLSHFDATGGIERWGYPTSDVFEESAGALTQYYQRGVLDYRPGRGVERRLVWDYLGGGLGGSPDMGVEPGT
ncbi:MAG: hypothetical protein FJ029_00385 [Actinobacteria bacterium]|nr:hypothetical protein [Actinomycetota bacterium]